MNTKTKQSKIQRVNSLWQFTLVHRYSLTRLHNVFVFANSYRCAKNKVFRIFPKELFEVGEALIMPNDIVLIAPITSEHVNLLDNFVDSL